MVVGDPYKFAVIVDIVDEWNADTVFCNGVICFSINGKLFPENTISATLKSELRPFIKRLTHIGTDNRIYKLQKNEVFSIIYGRAFPDDTSAENDYRFFITPDSVSDDNCFLFAVSDGSDIRILASRLIYDMQNSQHILDGITIYETVVSKCELQEIIRKLEDYCNSFS